MAASASLREAFDTIAEDILGPVKMQLLQQYSSKAAPPTDDITKASKGSSANASAKVPRATQHYSDFVPSCLPPVPRAGELFPRADSVVEDDLEELLYDTQERITLSLSVGNLGLAKLAAKTLPLLCKQLPDMIDVIRVRLATDCADCRYRQVRLQGIKCDRPHMHSIIKMLRQACGLSDAHALPLLQTECSLYPGNLYLTAEERRRHHACCDPC